MVILVSMLATVVCSEPLTVELGSDVKDARVVNETVGVLVSMLTVVD